MLESKNWQFCEMVALNRQISCLLEGSLLLKKH
jgi:hypothetical protein